MYGEPENAFLVILLPLMHAFSDIKEQRRLLRGRIIREYPHATALSRHKQTIGSVVAVNQFNRTQWLRQAVVADRLPAFER